MRSTIHAPWRPISVGWWEKEISRRGLPRRRHHLRRVRLRGRRGSPPALHRAGGRRPVRVRGHSHQHPRHGHRSPGLQLARRRQVGRADVVQRAEVRPHDPRHRGRARSSPSATTTTACGCTHDADGRSVLAVNNEYTNLKIMYGGSGSGAPANADDVRKGKAAHGVSVVEIAENDGKWSIVVDSPYNRASPPTLRWRSPGRRGATTSSRPPPIRTAFRASAPGTTAGTGARPGAPTSRARRTSTATTPRAIPTSRSTRVQALRRGTEGPGIRMGDGGRAIRHREAPERVESQWLHRRDRPAGSRIRPRRSGPRWAGSSTRTRRSSSPVTDRWSPTWATTSAASSSTSS